MACEQEERPITYADVFDVQGRVGDQPVTLEDASLMQRLESMAVGCTQKDSAASAMQSAADRNIDSASVRSDAHTSVADKGMKIEQAPAMPGSFIQTEFVAGQPVAAAIMVQQIEAPSPDVPVQTRTIPVNPAHPVEAPITLDATNVAPANNILEESVTLVSSIVIVTTPEPVTIGQALEAAAVCAGDSELERADVRAIESAESRATGQNLEKGGIAATAQSAVAAVERIGSPTATKVTLSDVLTGASEELPADKIVTEEDAAKVTAAELRGRPSGDVKMGGVADCMQVAAEINKVI